MSPRQLTIRRSSTRARHFIGGDRLVILLSGFIGALLGLFGEHLWIRALAIVICASGVFWGRGMVKRDPLFRHVWFRRANRYHQGVYLARCTPFRKNRDMQMGRYR